MTREEASNEILQIDSPNILCELPTSFGKTKIALDLESHDINYVLLSRYNEYITKLRFFFDHGCFRFKNQECKNAIINMLCYKQI